MGVRLVKVRSVPKLAVTQAEKKLKSIDGYLEDLWSSSEILEILIIFPDNIIEVNLVG